MAKLVRVEDLRLRLGLQNLAPLNDRISAAIDSATPHIESALQTSFDLSTDRVEDFYVEFHRDEPLHLDFVRLRLSQGFVSGTPELKLAALYQELSVGDVLDPAIYGVDNSKGVIFLSDEQVGLTVTTIRRLAVNRYYLRVKYTAGLSVTTTEFGDVYDNVPSWLKEVAYLLSSRLYRSFSPDEEHSLDADVSTRALSRKRSGLFPTAAIALLEKHIRFVPQAIDPIVNGYN